MNAEKAPISVKNFLGYVADGFYNNTIFHRVIPNFMIQGGGLDQNMVKKHTQSPITNEAANGLLNKRGTLAMARTSAPNSATAQFFINLTDNVFLNHSSGSPGYAVFGKVVHGMDVVDKIAKVATTRRQGRADVPIEPVVISEALIMASTVEKTDQTDSSK